MGAQTLRGRLTLWNLAVLTLILILFGLVLNYLARQRLAGDIDGDVMQRAHQAANPPPPPPNPRRRPDDRFGGPDRPDGGMFGEGLGGPPPEEAPPPQSDPYGNLRRPERFDREGDLRGPTGRLAFDSKLLAQALAGREALGDANWQGIHLRVAAVPIYRDGRLDGAVETARELTDYDSLWKSQNLTLVILIPVALLVAGLGAFFLTNRALLPIARATEAAAKISDEDMSARLEVRGADELAKLSGTFNSMLDRLQAAFQAQKSAYGELEKAYEYQRRFTADASHELRTPLTRLKLATGTALSESGLGAIVAEALQIADQSADAMTKIVNQLLLLSRADAGQLGLSMKPLDLRVVAAEAADSLPKRTPVLDVSLPETPVMVEGDADHLGRVVINLLQNAYKNTPEGKRVRMAVIGENGNSLLTVTDDGWGIPAEHVPHLGERFYRVDPARSQAEGGVGLGLSICKSIVEAHHGSISFESEVGKGTQVVVRVPRKLPD